MTDILTNLRTLGIIILVLLVLHAGATYLWNRKYLPLMLSKGKLKKPLGTILKEINQYTFKEDSGTLAKKGSQFLQKLFSYRGIHIAFIVGGAIIYALTGNIYALLALPLSFMVGISRAMPVTKRRTEVLDRIFLIASSSIKFTSGPRAKNAVPPASWNHINVEKWNGKEAVSKMVISFPAGNGPELNAQKTFEKSFEANATSENIWNFEWDLPHDQVTIEAAPLLPTKLLYPGSGDAGWSVFPVGESSAGVASYDVSTFPHALCAGPSGSGKSVLQRNIVFHTIQHNHRWRFLGVDLKRVELTPYNKYKKTIMGIATDVEQGVAVLKYAYNEMMDRYIEMERIGVNNVMDMADPPYCILLMIDEATMFLGASGSKTEEGKAEDALKGEASDLVGKILRLGRASGIHMLIAMQRPDATVLKGEFKANMDVRLAAGRMDSTPSAMVLDTGEAVNLPGIRGRGLIRVGGSLTTFQGYFAPQDWIDDFILKNPHVEPSCIAPGGHLHDKFQAMKRLEAKATIEGELVEDEEGKENKADKKNPDKKSKDKPEDKPSKKPKFGLKGLKKGKSEESEAVIPAESAPTPPPVAPAVTEPEVMQDFTNYADDPVTENKQSLIDSLSRKEEDALEGAGSHEIPDFFTGGAKKDEPSAHTMVEPDLELDDDDFILDDFDDDEDGELPAPPADILTPSAGNASPAPVKHEWVSASPFGGDVEDAVSNHFDIFGGDDELEDLPKAPPKVAPTPVKATPVRVTPPSPVAPISATQRPAMPTRPVRPAPVSPPAAAQTPPAIQRPVRPSSPFAPKPSSSDGDVTGGGNPFLPKK